MTDVQGLHVLLVEDNPEERWLFGEILRSRGHTVTSCEDAESGWEAYLQTQPSLLLLDWILPGMDGLALCRKIREHERNPRCVIVVVTGKDSPEDLGEVMEAGADDYITKPADVALLEIRLAVAEQRVIGIRERQSVRDALEAKTLELEALFMNLDEVVFSVDAVNQTLIQVSPAVTELMGVTPEALLSEDESWRKILCPPDMKGKEDCIRELFGEGPREFEYEVTRPDGETLWVKVTLKPALSSTGEIVRLDGLLTDMTARKVVEDELSARNLELLTLNKISEITLSSRDLEAALPKTLDWIIEATGFPVAFLQRLDEERGCLVLLGEKGMVDSPSDSVEIPLHESLGALAVEGRKPVAVEDAKSHPRVRNEFLLRQNLRSYVAFPLVASGRVLGVLALADTEIREIPPRLLKWGESLANSLASFVERVDADNALREGEHQALKLAEDLRHANEELEAFAYSVSHDLRAPLRTMQGFAHALLREHGDSLPPQARDFARRIIDSGRRSEELIRDLLAYSRMSFEELELQELDLGQAFTDAQEQVAAYLSEREAKLTLPESFPTVLAHHTTLVQVLANLISNAVKFVPDDRKPVVVLRWEEEEDGERIRLWVEDNGIGVPEEQRERIFKVFERLEGEVEREGTGIGLAIVRRAMDRVGGRVGVVPNEDEGSRFWIEVPKSRPKGWRQWGKKRGRKE
jgi:PAS domain S-box-containing protein